MNKKKFVMKQSTLLVSLICNLKCKLCVADSPYETNREFPRLSALSEYFRRYFEIVDYVELFSFSGGEPLLYPQLPELLEDFLTYSDKFGKIEIITNGTVVPNEKLIKAAEKYGDKFRRIIIDDYGRELSKNALKAAEALKEHNIPYELRDYYSENMHCGGWVDYGDFKEKIRSDEETAILFSKCAHKKTNFCFTIYNGIMVPCGPVRRRLRLGFPVNGSEYINLTDNETSAEEQRKKITDIYNAEFFETCAYCKGLCDDSERFKPAVQLANAEERSVQA